MIVIACIGQIWLWPDNDTFAWRHGFQIGVETWLLPVGFYLRWNVYRVRFPPIDTFTSNVHSRLFNVIQKLKNSMFKILYIYKWNGYKNAWMHFLMLHQKGIYLSQLPLDLCWTNANVRCTNGIVRTKSESL